MNRLNLRRVVAVAAGALLGLAGVATVAAPASAHHSEVKVTAECDTAAGEWITTWTVRAVAPSDVQKFKLIEVNAQSKKGDTTESFTIEGIQATQDDSYPYAVAEPWSARPGWPVTSPRRR